MVKVEEKETTDMMHLRESPPPRNRRGEGQTKCDFRTTTWRKQLSVTGEPNGK